MPAGILRSALRALPVSGHSCPRLKPAQLCQPAEDAADAAVSVDDAAASVDDAADSAAASVDEAAELAVFSVTP